MTGPASSSRESVLLRLEWTAALLLTAFAAWAHGARLAHAGGLWRDEAAAARLATLPSLAAVWRLFPHEAFPLAVPLAIRSFARLAGDGDAALRAFGMLVGVAGIAALWLAARAAGRTLPLLSLALLAGNAPFVVFGDSLRGYGLGSVCVILGFAALARLLQRPGPWSATAALLAMVGAAQCLLGNAALVAALCAAAALAALAAGFAARPKPAADRRRAGLRVAWVAIAIGLAAALSLVPYALSLAAARGWSEVVVYRPDLPQILRVLWATLAPLSAAWAALCALAVAGGIGLLTDRWRGTGGDPEGSTRLLSFAALALVLGILAQLAFQYVLGYTPRAWYDLPLLALVACALESLGAQLCRQPPARLARVVLALALAAAALPAELPRLRLRMTNADLIARQLETAAAAEDLVVVAPWYYGVSFNRYRRGPASWVTLPDLPDHQIHRYDLLKERLAAPHPIDDVLDLVRRTLSGGHRVWLVGQLRFPPPGHPAPVLPPAPGSPAGWHDLPYVESWSMQLGSLLRSHADAMARVQVPSPDPVSPLEDMTLAVASGWHP